MCLDGQTVADLMSVWGLLNPVWRPADPRRRKEWADRKRLRKGLPPLPKG